jgi:Protein of unknown function (DUF4058)
MPLFDYFHPPRQRVGWESIHSGWVTRIADSLNELLPRGYVALETKRLGLNFEVDVGVIDEEPGDRIPPNGAPIATLAARIYTPAPPRRTFAPMFPDTFEVRVFETNRPDRIYAAIELISPSNKDRPAERAAFAAKCAGYLAEGTSVMIADVVTIPNFNLHHELLRLLGESDSQDSLESEPLYVAAYSAVRRGERGEIDIWAEPMAIGEPLPTLPL